MAIPGPVGKAFGQPIKRREDPRLITGAATFVDDVRLPGMLYMAVVRSPYAHARIRAIHTEAARGAPGVVAVAVAADLTGQTTGPLPVEIDLNLFQDARDSARQVLTPDDQRYHSHRGFLVICGR